MKSRGSVFVSIVCALASFALVTPALAADGSLSVTVTPPLFQLTIGPGETWKSSLKVVNTNSYDVSYYAEPVDFSAEGENGQSKFAPILDQSGNSTANSYSLASWIEVTQSAVVIPSHTSADIPFTVHVPANAEPGGHYAAILVGTRPPHLEEKGASMLISSYVSSLLFVRIEGDVRENGRIREFRTGNSLYQSADADFLLRFENTGNTHLQPQGVITIYNMWGKERGELLINHESNFGNVLPKSIRKFEFSWTGEQTVFDIGRYNAVVTLNYGANNKQNTSATTYFWVVPVVPVTSTLLGIITFILLITWFIRRYIRRALALEEARRGFVQSPAVTTTATSAAKSTPTYSFETFIEPIKEGVVDLRRASGAKPATARVPSAETVHASDAPLTWAQFLNTYKLFFLFVMVMIIGGVSMWLYLHKVLVSERAFEIKSVSTLEEIQ